VSGPLRKRVVTALVLAVAMLAVILCLPPHFTVFLITLIVLLGAWEWSAFLRLPVVALRFAYVSLIGVLMFAAWSFSVTAEGRAIIMGIALAWWCVALLWVMFAPRRVATWSAAVAGVLALVPGWLALIRLEVMLPLGAQWVAFVLIMICLADVGAYFAGRYLGRIKLAPQVSPAKTWEGVLGGLALSGLCALAGGAWFHLPWGEFLLVCLAAIGFSVVGDLTESLLKRYAGVKDSGNLFPGHGGVMDRIDSITGATPVLFIGLMFMGVAR
jgi:phosphatidate cytidylyltransferase